MTLTSAPIATKTQWTLSHGVPHRHVMDQGVNRFDLEVSYGKHLHRSNY